MHPAFPCRIILGPDPEFDLSSNWSCISYLNLRFRTQPWTCSITFMWVLMGKKKKGGTHRAHLLST